ncbi:3-phosphoshikimate 1-carboxyvinyltransferase [Paenibacillus paeoniae]|uniref:3-phosphoshikimate 1-carboxyvinyltransferase n=2 Tax=Paenibacillus paeoniae TaxID=2292705 RepID=A0A371PQ78_9BACL|nr:3-phosphoshikimate 1-carboxyvinyltransferase [Paenibacillus paeoniae]
MPDLEARSPWSVHQGIHQVKISPPRLKVNSVIRVSGSKSLTNRALIIAAMAEGISRIEGILRSDDAYWCIESLRELGIDLAIEGDTAIVTGCGGKWPAPRGQLYVGAAGTVARFLPAALAAGQGEWTLTGSKRMSERPIEQLLMALTDQGAGLQYLNQEHAYPFVLQGNGLNGGNVQLAGNLSSQFVSGLLVAAPYANQPMTIHMQGVTVQREYVNMTIDMMRSFGVEAAEDLEQNIYHIPSGKYSACTIKLEPDISTCCYFWAMAALTEGYIRTEGIYADRTRQPDIEMLEVLERMGCTVVRGEDGAVEVHGTSQLRGGFELSMARWSDQTLTIAAMAPFADAPITMKDAAHIRHHECDRISAICTELRKLSIRVEEHADGLTVYPGHPEPALLDTYDDHRMAMALSLIGLKAEGITILDPGCISKTCPDYFSRLRELGAGIHFFA